MQEQNEQRVDIYLATVRVIRPRGQAKVACDNGIISVDGNVAKPSTKVRVNTVINVRFTDQDLKLRVVRLAGKSVRKQDAADYYEILQQERIV
jgi:ribosomal 50S subunit-recycling heat shock protein